jgi:hypothetical protein
MSFAEPARHTCPRRLCPLPGLAKRNRGDRPCSAPTRSPAPRHRADAGLGQSGNAPARWPRPRPNARPLAPGIVPRAALRAAPADRPPPPVGQFVLPGNAYHVYDIPLFWANCAPTSPAASRLAAASGRTTLPDLTNTPRWRPGTLMITGAPTCAPPCRWAVS